MCVLHMRVDIGLDLDPRRSITNVESHTLYTRAGGSGISIHTLALTIKMIKDNKTMIRIDIPYSLCLSTQFQQFLAFFQD